MKRIFLDTVGLIALWDTSDQWHSVASTAYEALCQGPFVAVSSPLVLLECANAGARRPYRRLLTDLRARLVVDEPLIAPSAAQLDDAWRTYAAGSAGSATVVDLVSFALMRDLAITDAFTNDKRFKAAGFQTLF